MDKKLILTMLGFMLSSSTLLANPITPDCTFNGKPLYGPVRIVSSFPDVKIQVVDHFADLHVKKTAIPTRCGEWKIGDRPGSLRVQLVEHFPDIKIKFVDHFPGRQP